MNSASQFGTGVLVPVKVATGNTAGTANDAKVFMSAAATAFTVGTTAISFTAIGTSYSAGTGLGLAGTTFSVTYGTASGTAAQGNDTRITGALQTSALGANVQTALGVAVGTAGAFVVNGGALGTPSSGTLTNATGLPIAGLTGLGTGVATALAVAAGTAAGFAVLSGGVLTAAEMPALTGDVTNTAGTLGTTVNNTASTGFMKYTNKVINETVGGTINSSNTAFTLANTPATCRGGASSVELMYNGQQLDAGAGNDFTISGTAITMLFAPQTGDKLRANYLV